jgi:ribosomal RNA-processing protein 36
MFENTDHFECPNITYQAEQEMVQKGKKPFFLKDSDRKTLALVEKFEKSKAAGTLTSQLTMKRKRNSSKLKKTLPDRR